MASVDVSPAEPGSLFPTVNVLCAYQVSAHFDFNHRLAYYLSILFLLTAPAHRILTPLVSSFVILFGLFNAFYASGLAFLPARLGPSLDIYPLHAILLTSTYAFATLIFCRTGTIKGKRAWGALMKWFFVMWAGFVVANFGKDMFEKQVVPKMMSKVECKALKDTHCGEEFFVASKQLACRNPCAAPNTSGIMLPGQALLKPVVWGTISKAGDAMAFCPKPRPDLSWVEITIVVLFGVALSLTLWINFSTNPRVTRNTVFFIFGGRGAPANRNSLAKITALSWFAWSYFALLLVAVALPFVVTVQEALLRSYPVARSCGVKAWLPWVAAMALSTALFLGIRKRIGTFWKKRQHRVAKLEMALVDVKAKTDEPGTTAEVKAAVDSLIVQVDKYRRFVRRCGGKDDENCKLADGIVEPRDVTGLCDAFRELREWWMDPLGEAKYQPVDAKPSTVDEEKALLAEHYADHDARNSVDEPAEKLSEMEA